MEYIDEDFTGKECEEIMSGIAIKAEKEEQFGRQVRRIVDG